MSRLGPFLMALLLGGIATFAWWWPNRPGAGGPPIDERFQSVSFAPFRRGQSPLTDRFPTELEVNADLALVATRAGAIRTYAANEGGYDTAALAGRHGLTMWLGVWLGADPVRNAAEIARGIALAHAHPGTVQRVIVGNEVLLRRDLPPAELMAAIDQVRAAIAQPVSYADVWEFWEQFPELADHVDIVTIHLLPYWEDAPVAVDQAVAHVGAIHDRLAARFPGKPIAIGETGWPSRGRMRDGASPGRVNQARFLREFMALSRRAAFDYNLIEAFDQGWKYRNEGVVGANWGIWTAGREAKFTPAETIVEHPDWPAAAGLSVLSGLLLAVAGAWSTGWRADGRIRIVVLAMPLGAALAYAYVGTWPVLYDGASLLAGVVNLVGQTLLAVLWMVRAARRPAIPVRTGFDTSAAILRLRGFVPFEDLAFLFTWTAALLQLLLLVDPRYRDFPYAAFAVPLVVVVSRAIVGDLPRGGGGRAELAVGAVLALGAVGSAIREGWLNTQSLGWTACALILAMPPLLRLRA